jgi:zeaxanthin glucosyltransferase
MKVLLPQLTVARLRKTVQQVLTQASYRQNAQRLQQEIRQSSGASYAATIAEQAILTREPVCVEDLYKSVRTLAEPVLLS